MEELTKEQAVRLYKSGWWKDRSDVDIVKFQLFTERLCLPFDRFHEAIENVLGRGVFTHEFGSVGVEFLRQEFLGERQAPTFAEILALIPQEKQIIVIRHNE